MAVHLLQTSLTVALQNNKINTSERQAYIFFAVSLASKSASSLTGAKIATPFFLMVHSLLSTHCSYSGPAHVLGKEVLQFSWGDIVGCYYVLFLHHTA